MKYIIVKAKDLLYWQTEYDEVATCGDIIINCDYITRMESFEERGDNPRTLLVLHMLNGIKFTIQDNIPIETNWDLIMCYHKKSTRIEL